MVKKIKQQHQDSTLAAEKSALPLSQCLSYSAPYIMVMWMISPIPILQGVYAKYYGVSMVTLASIFFLARISDAITDPLIGFYSDRYRRNSGTRKPFVVAGSLLLMVSCYFLFVPYGIDSSIIFSSHDLQTPQISTLYFAGWFILFYLGWTLFDIPHNAWASELSASAEDKSKIYSFRSMAAYMGMVCFYAVPLLPFFETNDITPATLKISVLVAIALLIPTMYICISRTPNDHLVCPSNTVSGEGEHQIASEGQTHTIVHRWHLLKSIIHNKPLLIFLSAFMCSIVSTALWYSGIFLYVDSYLGLGEQFAPMFLLAFIVSVLITPIWCKLSVVLGKKNVLTIATTFILFCFIYTATLRPGDTSLLELVFLKLIHTSGAACLGAIAPALLSEIIDYSRWKYRSENTAVYFSLFLFTQKFSLAIGTALGLAIIGWSGYDATATTQNAEATAGLMLAMVWIPGIIAIIAFGLYAASPISTRRYGIIRRRLDLIEKHSSRCPSSPFGSKTLPLPEKVKPLTA